MWCPARRVMGIQVPVNPCVDSCARRHDTGVSRCDRKAYVAPQGWCAEAGAMTRGSPASRGHGGGAAPNDRRAAAATGARAGGSAGSVREDVGERACIEDAIGPALDVGRAAGAHPFRGADGQGTEAFLQLTQDRLRAALGMAFGAALPVGAFEGAAVLRLAVGEALLVGAFQRAHDRLLGSLQQSLE